MMHFTIIPVTPFEQNCTLLVCPQSRHAVIVDPGGDLPRILQHVEKQTAIVQKILLTHGHLDHCSAAGTLAQQLNVPIEGPHRAEQFWLDLLVVQRKDCGFPADAPVVPTRWLDNGDKVYFGEQTLDVYHCPGHTPGHIIFYSAQDQLALVGDVLFSGSIGRTDFPRSNHADLIHAIREKLWPLGNDVRFIPGHGPMSTFGIERATNPYVSDAVLGMDVSLAK